MAGSGQDTGETLGYKRRDLSAQVKKKGTKIYSTEEQGEGWKRKPCLPDICTYLKSFPIKFIMNLIQSPMAQRNVLGNKNVLLRDR